MTPEEVSKLPDYTPNPVFKGLSAYVKDPKNFDDIQMKLHKTLANGHEHKDLLEYSNCFECTRNMIRRRQMLEEYGFKNPRQYMAWRKVHEEIRRIISLPNWKNLPSK